MTIPTREEISIYGSRDEQAACAHFLGKNLDEAEALFRENSICYQADLMWMGPVAFRYYVEAAIRYVRSDAATGDSDMINCLAGLLEFRLEHGRAELTPVAGSLAGICDYVVERYDRFDMMPEVYGDVRARFVALGETFKRLTLEV